MTATLFRSSIREIEVNIGRLLPGRLSHDQAYKDVRKELLQNHLPFSMNEERFPSAVSGVSVLRFDDAGVRIRSDHLSSHNQPCLRIDIELPAKGGEAVPGREMADITHPSLLCPSSKRGVTDGCLAVLGRAKTESV